MATFITCEMRPSNITQIRVNNIVTCLDTAVETLEIIAKGLETPFLQPILSTVRSLLVSVQGVKRNQDDCARMLEHIHGLLYAIIRLHIDSDTGGELSPSMLKSLGQFTETLHKIHTFVDVQKEKSIIKQFFRQGEISTLLKGCNDGLQQAFEGFKVQHAYLLSDAAEMQAAAQATHQKVLVLISSLSDGTSSSGISSFSKQLEIPFTVAIQTQDIPW
ncbi:hypothetical protein DFH09DRAFT_1362626 [Mycena vulgaris]|nr:hypothetical protein DFH09DRAFT_1362626 [Mycena vulgaris]